MNFRGTSLDQADEDALQAAAARAPRYFVTGGQFRASVTSCDVRDESYERVLHTIEHRGLVLHAAAGGQGPLRSMPDPNGTDPWSLDPATVESDTRVVTTCGACDGAAQVRCSRCNGTTWASCPYCVGGAQLSRQKGRLLRQCTHCRGSGKRKCTDCRHGLVACVRCEATGRLTAWLSMQRTLQHQVKVHPFNAAASVHERIRVPADFDAGAWRSRLVRDGAVATLSTLTSELQPDLDPRADRIVACRLQSFSSAVRCFAVETVLSDGIIEVAGNPPAVASTSRWGGLALRRLLMLAAAVGGTGIAFAVMQSYESRHAWYQTYGDATGVFALAAVAAMVGAAAVGALLLAARARSPVQIAALLGTTAAFVLGTVFAFEHPAPRASVARDRLVVGDLARAHDEAQALLDLGIDPDAGRDVLDALHLLRAKRATDIAELAETLHEPWFGTRAQNEAANLLPPLAGSTASRLFAAHDASRLERLADALSAADPAIASGYRALATALRVVEHAAAADEQGTMAALDQLQTLAPTIPALVRPASWTALMDASAQLRVAFVATRAQSRHAQSRAWSDVATAAAACAQAVGLDPSSASRNAATRARDIEEKLSRAAAHRKRAASEDATSGNFAPVDDEPSAAADPSQNPSGSSSTNQILNPY